MTERVKRMKLEARRRTDRPNVLQMENRMTMVLTDSMKGISSFIILYQSRRKRNSKNTNEISQAEIRKVRRKKNELNRSREEANQRDERSEEKDSVPERLCH